MGIRTPTLQEAEAHGSEFASKAQAADLKALRAVGAAELVRLATAPPPREGQPSGPPPLRFAPNVDGVIVGMAPEAGVQPLNNVPLLTGFNTDEGGLSGNRRTTPADFEAEV